MPFEIGEIVVVVQRVIPNRMIIQLRRRMHNVLHPMRETGMRNPIFLRVEGPVLPGSVSVNGITQPHKLTCRLTWLYACPRARTNRRRPR